jgi:sRNA-binding carbon storage regulator CsrA
MPDAVKRLGQCLRIGTNLEVVVLDLALRHIKLGIRQLDSGMQDLSWLACRCPRSCHAYYRSGDGGTMLVVCPLYGQSIEINQRISLRVIRVNAKRVRLISTSLDHLDTPAAAERACPVGFAGGDAGTAPLKAGALPQF